MPLTVALVPLPEVVTAPGVLVKVQLPVADKPFKTTLPVDTVQLGCVIVPTVGAVGTTREAFITTFVEDAEVHPTELVTL
jgi:hypothetical protein